MGAVAGCGAGVGVTGTRITGDDAGRAGEVSDAGPGAGNTLPGCGGVGSLLGRNQPWSEAAVTPTASVTDAAAAPTAMAIRRVDGTVVDIDSSGHERRKYDESDDCDVHARLLSSWPLRPCFAIPRMCDARDREELRVVSPTDVHEPASPRALAMLFVAMAVLVGIDLILDLGDKATLPHALLELLVVFTGFVAAAKIALRLRRSARDAQQLRAHAAHLAESLRVTREQAERWRSDAADLIAGLSAAIDAQFARWELSPAEREIALLLLKGLSHKEIAQIRSVSETTVRQQARSLYRKAGLSGRNDLAAFFLEDLLGPREATEASA